MKKAIKSINSVELQLIVFFVILLFIGCGGGGGTPANPPQADSLEIVSQNIVYRAFENPSWNRYQVWIEITKNGTHIQDADLDEINITDSAGNSIVPVSSGFWEYAYMYYDCTTAPCTDSGPFEGTGFYSRFDDFPADTYEVEAITNDGLSDTVRLPYDGILELPVVASATMQSQLDNGDLVLSWTNPTNGTNWDKVDSLTVRAYDRNGLNVIQVEVDPANDTVTVPASLVKQAIGLGGGSLTSWRVLTSACDANGMNYARGYSNTVDFSYAVNYSYLQYRNYENPANNRYSSWIGISKDGGPADPADVKGFKISDSSGNDVVPTFSDFFVSSPYLFFNCNTTPCTQTDNIIDTGFWGSSFDDLSADTYLIEVEAADGQLFTAEVDYPGQLVLPFVSSATMQSQYQNGDLVLSWTNPDGAVNWDEVDQLRIVIYAEDGAEAIYVRPNRSDETVTIPESLVNQANALGHGDISSWQIQTRAFDSINMNLARGISNTIALR